MVKSKVMTLKIKLIIIGVIIGLFCTMLYVSILVSILSSEGEIDVGDTNSSGGGDNTVTFSNIDSSNSYLWPIGSEEIEIHDGNNYAIGKPVNYSVDKGFNTGDYGHTGTDISPGDSTSDDINIIASKDGTVIYPSTNDRTDCPPNGQDTSCGNGYGNYVKIDHGDGTQTLYAHLKENSITVKSGDKVKGGQVIGIMGNTGDTTEKHLHFEVYENSSRVDPLNGYISKDNTRPTKNLGYVAGNDNIQTICLTLKGAGYSDDAVAAMMGNIYAESSYTPTAVNELGCIGIVQWCFGRKDAVKHAYGQDWNKLDNQLNYFLSELNGSYTYVNNKLNDSRASINDKTNYFCNRFEVPGESVCAQNNRRNEANAKLSYVKNGCK